ncbi:MAG: hypothetical protein QM756_16630 [Polyangiaceae bacterium]
MIGKPLISVVVALSAAAMGCGQAAHDPVDASAQGGGGGAAGGSGSDAPYTGVVLAEITKGATEPRYTARAVFSRGPHVAIGGCPRCCCGRSDRGLPLPDKPPDAGEITLAVASDSTPLGTLVPDPFENGVGTLYGMTDLGWSWFAPLSNYAAVASPAWNSSALIKIQARGNEIGGFNSTFRAGPEFLGVNPPIGATTLVIDHRQPFEVSWNARWDQQRDRVAQGAHGKRRLLL